MKELVRIRSLNRSAVKGEVKQPLPEIRVSGKGIEGDAHAGPWHRQVSMLAAESIGKYEKECGTRVKDGGFGENITTEGMALHRARPLDRFVCGEVILELTQVGKKCHGERCSIYKQSGKCIMPDEGIFCRVIKGGMLRTGDHFQYVPYTFRMKVITLSDRAHGGFYEDRSGPAILGEMGQWFDGLGLRHQDDHVILPDEKEPFSQELAEAIDEGVDLVFTTGGTGLGSRDMAPEVALQQMDRQIPGIMELIRAKYGMVNPNAALSRSVAGQAGKTLIFVLPGSARAVGEYMQEICRSLWHMILMVHDIDSH